MDHEQLVEKANKKILKRDSRLKIGGADICIIAGFLREKVNIVHSGDKAFLETCKELGLNIAPLPKRDIETENKIKKISKHRKH